MSTAVLLSIKPEFAHAIFSGEKKYEFRKSIFRNTSVNTVYVYASAPLSKVIGVFSVDEILEQHPIELWKRTSYAAGISEDFFHDYFEGRELGYALKVKGAKLFRKSMNLIELFGISHPPQSFRYVPMCAHNI